MTEVAKIARQIWDRASYDVRATLVLNLVEWRINPGLYAETIQSDLLELFTVFHQGDNPFVKLEWTHGFDEAKATTDALAKRQGDDGLEQGGEEEQEEGEEVRDDDRGLSPRVHRAELADDSKQRANRSKGGPLLSRPSGFRRRGV